MLQRVTAVELAESSLMAVMTPAVVRAGESLTELTVIATVSVADENGVEAPLELASTLLPFVPEV